MNYTYPIEQSFVLGPMRFHLETDGEKIRSGYPETGFLHRGIEKICENLKWISIVPYTERVDYLAPIHCSLAYVLAVEKLAAIQVPERGQRIRIIVSEFNRISSHLMALGLSAKAIGLKTVFVYTLRDREKINNLFEMLCGARVLYTYMRIGGVSSDLTDGFIEKSYEFLDYIRAKLKEYNDLLFNNVIFKGRSIGRGQLTSSYLISCSVSGPNLRASGCKLDVRRSLPYSGYEKIEFQVPIGSSENESIGDSYERFRVRFLEIEQSIAILKQALKKVPNGEFLVSMPKLFKPPAGESIAFVESPRGTFGVFIRSRGEKTPDRIKFLTPSLSVLNIFPKVLENSSITDLPIILSSLDLSVSEVDR